MKEAQLGGGSWGLVLNRCVGICIGYFCEIVDELVRKRYFDTLRTNEGRFSDFAEEFLFF